MILQIEFVLKIKMNLTETKNLGTIKFRALYSWTSSLTSDKSSSQGTGKNNLRLVLVLSSTVAVINETFSSHRKYLRIGKTSLLREYQVL